MDPFALLSSGARFDKRKKPAAAVPKAVNYTVAQPLPELPSKQQQPRRKRKKQQAAADANGDHRYIAADAGFSLFGGSGQAQQQQKQPQQQEPELPEVHTRDPQEEANVIRKALKIKVRRFEHYSLLRLLYDGKFSLQALCAAAQRPGKGLHLVMLIDDYGMKLWHEHIHRRVFLLLLLHQQLSPVALAIG
jgi:hypothetical protein